MLEGSTQHQLKYQRKQFVGVNINSYDKVVHLGEREESFDCQKQEMKRGTKMKQSMNE
jgi:hypothetical protein